MLAAMEFDAFSIVLLQENPDWAGLDAEAARALQDAHLAHLAELHDAGHLLAAGPLDDATYIGLSILSVGPDEARALKEADPAVQAGRFTITVIPWMVPAGAIAWAPTFFPRSVADVLGPG
jgi:uncharacterized protein YciI